MPTTQQVIQASIHCAARLLPFHDELGFCFRGDHEREREQAFSRCTLFLQAQSTTTLNFSPQHRPFSFPGPADLL